MKNRYWVLYAHSMGVKFLLGHLPLIKHNIFCYPHAILG